VNGEETKEHRISKVHSDQELFKLLEMKWLNEVKSDKYGYLHVSYQFTD